MTNQIIAYKKVNEIILSCETLIQLQVAEKLVVNFNRLFGKSDLSAVLNILLERKKFLIEMETQPVVYFLIGCPGSGKSTYVKEVLMPSGDYFVASSDDIITKKGAHIGMNYNKAFNHFNFKDIEKEFRTNINKAINERLDIIIDRTNMNDKGRYKLLRLFPKDYIKIAIVFDFKDTEKIKTQLAKREKEEGKYISDVILYKMIKSYVEPTSNEFDQIIKL